MRFVVRDTVSIQKDILKSPIETQGAAIAGKLLLPFQDIEAAIKPNLFDQYGPTEDYLAAIERLEQNQAIIVCREALEKSYQRFWEAKFLLDLKEVHFGLFLGNPESRGLKLNHGYTGIEPVPGYIAVAIWPDEYTLPRLASAVAHEFNHQMRISSVTLKDPTLGEYLVLKGLADSFSERLFGKELSPPWVNTFSAKDLHHSKEGIRDLLQLRGMNNIEKYMFGDKLAEINGDVPVDLPDAAGYGVGYHLVQAYLKETGKSIVEATMAPTQEILTKSGFFMGV